MALTGAGAPGGGSKYRTEVRERVVHPQRVPRPWSPRASPNSANLGSLARSLRRLRRHRGATGRVVAERGTPKAVRPMRRRRLSGLRTQARLYDFPRLQSRSVFTGLTPRSRRPRGLAGGVDGRTASPCRQRRAPGGCVRRNNRHTMRSLTGWRRLVSCTQSVAGIHPRPN